VRLVAATHRDLQAMIREEKFREDLFYRFNVFPIEIPPIAEAARGHSSARNYLYRRYRPAWESRLRSIPKRTMEMLTNCPWNGKHQELANFIERAVILYVVIELDVPISGASHVIRDQCLP
jgi:sigma-54 specific flagellar transcriptional regulator A